MITKIAICDRDKEYMYNLTSVYEADENWLLDLIGLVANAIASLLNWVVDFLGTRLLPIVLVPPVKSCTNP